MLVLLACIVGFIIFSTVYSNNKTALIKEEADREFKDQMKNFDANGALEKLQKELDDIVTSAQDEADTILQEVDRAVESGNIEDLRQIVEDYGK